MKEVEAQEQGRKLLSVVERIIADTDTLLGLSQEHLRRAQELELASEAATLDAAAEQLVRHFSNRTAITGGLAAVPALLPGAGTLVAVAGGTLADMGMMLKYEVEMALVLSHLHGFDITKNRERQLAFLMASVSTYNAKTGRNILLDVAHAEGIAIWKYAPREVSKLLVRVLTEMALLQLSKHLLRALPLVGIAVGSSMNKMLTTRVGERCISELRERVRFEAEEAASRKAAEAKVRKPKKLKKTG